MSDLEEARLAQFWHARVAPLLGSKTRDGEWVPAFYEMAGWLSESVFCGYFDRQDADFVWIRIKEDVKLLPEISVAVASHDLVTRIRELQAGHNPFRSAAQMPEGAQRRFEEPLMPYAILLSNRLASDHIAAACSHGLVSLNDSEWDALLKEPLRHQDVLATLGSSAVRPAGLQLVIAGYYQLLTHMDESRRFFEYAERRAGNLRADFESYQQRIGALNAWRVALTSERFAQRFEAVGRRFDEMLLTAAAESPEGLTWTLVKDQLAERRKTLTSAWTKHHLAAFLQFA